MLYIILKHVIWRIRTYSSFHKILNSKNSLKIAKFDYFAKQEDRKALSVHIYYTGVTSFEFSNR